MAGVVERGVRRNDNRPALIASTGLPSVALPPTADRAAMRVGGDVPPSQKGLTKMNVRVPPTNRSRTYITEPSVAGAIGEPVSTAAQR
jgi:hypothetical protein